MTDAVHATLDLDFGLKVTSDLTCLSTTGEFVKSSIS